MKRMSSRGAWGTQPLASIGELQATTAIHHAWGRLRLMVLEGGPRESPDLRLLRHFFAFNLSEEVESDFRVEDGPWTSYRFGHHFFIFVPAGTHHRARRLPRRVLLLEVDAQFAEGVLRLCGDSIVLQPLIAVDDPSIAHILLALDHQTHASGVLGELHTEALGSALLTRLAYLCATTQNWHPLGGGMSTARLHRVLDHVAGHLGSPPSLQSLAELAGMDLYRFVRGFKQSTGLSPHRYVLNARIEFAKELLRDRSLAITDVALRTGFATPSHFSVTFRRATKMAPRTFRQLLFRRKKESLPAANKLIPP